MRRFLILYILYIAIAFFLVDYPPMRKMLHLEEIYNTLITDISAWFVSFLHIPVTASSNILHLPHANMIIKFGCNGLEAVLIYLAGVLAYEASWKMKIIWGAIGIALLEIINILRIALLAWTIEHYPKDFEIMHDYITQSIMIVLALLMFLFYIQRLEHAKENP